MDGITSTLLAAVAVLAGCAMAPRAAMDEAATLERRMQELSQAVVSADPSRLEAITWPELSFGHANGRVEARAQFIDALASRRSVIPRFELSSVKTQQVGDLAIARGTLAGSYLSAGKPVAFDLGFVMLWQRRQGEWRLLAHQAHKL